MGRGLIAMLGQHHPFDRKLYEQDGNGNVIVSDGTGASGLFRANGSWISGEIFEADPQMCGWIAGPKVRHHRLQAND
jgi:hypothetical protein